MANKPAIIKKKKNPQRPKNALYKPSLLNKNKNKNQPEPTIVEPKITKKPTKKQDIEEELNDEELIRQLHNIKDGADVEFDEEDDMVDDEDDDLIDFDDEGEINEIESYDEEDEELEGEDLSEEEGEEGSEEEDEELEGEDFDDEDDEDDEFGDDEENPDEEADDLFNEMKENLKEDEEEELPAKRIKSQAQAVPTKKLTDKVKFSGDAFQGVASVESILAKQNSKPIAKPVKIVNAQEELENDLAEKDLPQLSEDEDEARATPQSKYNKKYQVYDQEGINQKILELQVDQVPWVHSLSVLHNTNMKVADIHDDFQRESTFYQYAVDSVIACEKLCKVHNLAVKRKPDFFAEMIKSDEQMFKIKARIQKDKKRVEVGDQIRKKREIKKFGKQIQAEKLQEKQKQKTDVLDNVKKWRRAREKGNTSDEFSIDLLEENNDKKSKPKSNKRNREEYNNLPSKSKKRVAKDTKYGFGGKKRYAKVNDRESTSDLSSFSVAKNNADKYSAGKGGKFGAGNKGSKGSKGKGNNSRQGKSKRGSVKRNK